MGVLFGFGGYFCGMILVTSCLVGCTCDCCRMLRRLACLLYGLACLGLLWRYCYDLLVAVWWYLLRQGFCDLGLPCLVLVLLCPWDSSGFTAFVWVMVLLYGWLACFAG